MSPYTASVGNSDFGYGDQLHPERGDAAVLPEHRDLVPDLEVEDVVEDARLVGPVDVRGEHRRTQLPRGRALVVPAGQGRALRHLHGPVVLEAERNDVGLHVERRDRHGDRRGGGQRFCGGRLGQSDGGCGLQRVSRTATSSDPRAARREGRRRSRTSRTARRPPSRPGRRRGERGPTCDDGRRAAPRPGQALPRALRRAAKAAAPAAASPTPPATNGRTPASASAVLPSPVATPPAGGVAT